MEFCHFVISLVQVVASKGPSKFRILFVSFHLVKGSMLLCKIDMVGEAKNCVCSWL